MKLNAPYLLGQLYLSFFFVFPLFHSSSYSFFFLPLRFSASGARNDLESAA